MKGTIDPYRIWMLVGNGFSAESKDGKYLYSGIVLLTYIESVALFESGIIVFVATVTLNIKTSPGFITF